MTHCIDSLMFGNLQVWMFLFLYLSFLVFISQQQLYTGTIVKNRHFLNTPSWWNDLHCQFSQGFSGGFTHLFPNSLLADVLLTHFLCICFCFVDDRDDFTPFFSPWVFVNSEIEKKLSYPHTFKKVYFILFLFINREPWWILLFIIFQ